MCSNARKWKWRRVGQKNLSALVSETLDERLRRDELDAILDAMDAEYGPPSKSAKAWAKRVLGR